MKKIIYVVFMIFLVTGCTSSKKVNINKIKYNKFTLDYKLFGKYNDEYLNDNYEIYVNDDKFKIINKNKALYNNKTCTIDMLTLREEECKDNKNDIDIKKYSNIYLNSKINSNGIDEVIGGNTYMVYNATFKQNDINNLTGINFDSDCKGKIYMDSDNNIYNIIINLKGITIDLYYRNYNEDISIN